MPLGFLLEVHRSTWVHQPGRASRGLPEHGDSEGPARWQIHRDTRLRFGPASLRISPSLTRSCRDPATQWRGPSLHGEPHASFAGSPEADCPLPGRWGEPDGCCRANWRVLDGQRCAGFMGTAERFSYSYTSAHSSSDSLSIEVIRAYWVEFLWLYSKFSLIISYSRVSVFILNSWFSPHPPHFPFGDHRLVSEICTPISVLRIRSFVSILKLDLTCPWYHMILAFLCLNYFTWHDDVWVHPHCCVFKPDSRPG